MDLNNALNLNEYSLPQIINVDPQVCNNPLAVFQLFIDKEVINLIVTETNRYAHQITSANRKSRNKLWMETTDEEMYKFFGILICMGLVRVPIINLYWSKHPLYHNRFIASKMRRDRFLLLLQHIHFNNNENLPNSQDRLFRIRPLLTLLNTRYQNILTPGKEVVIDESMIPWRGRLGIRQYIKNKRHKYGVKLYKLCTLEGYTIRVKVYCGKEENQNVSTDPHTVRVVMSLMDHLLDSGRILYGDNFYSGVSLVKKLQSKKTFYCGTLRANRRGLPKGFIKYGIKKNEVVGVHNSKGVKIIKWQDKRPILMITNKKDHGISLQDTGKKNRKSEPVLKPKCIIDYNKAKKGVDLSDQMSSYYTSLRKGLKWYRKTAFELILGTTIVNSQVVFNEMNKNNHLNMLQFRENLGLALIEQGSDQQNSSSASTPKRIHTFAFEQGPGTKRRRNCVGCYKKLRATLSSKEADKKVTKVSSYCADCEKNPAMCLSCFNEKHSNLSKLT